MLLAARTAITAAPLAGPIAADLFLAHRWSARLLARAIERRIGKEGGVTDAEFRVVQPAAG